MTQVIPTKNRWLIIIAVMSATLMQALDTTIVNVALPHMQGALNASADQISWTLTSYLVASGIFMPLTGYFSDKLSQKNYLLLSIAGFTFASALCGAAETLPELIIFRLLQGAFGAALVPISQAILADAFPAEEQGKAMAIWGAGVMLGPILGPTLGGYLTDIASWRWTFYVNVPVGILTALLAWQVIPAGIKKARSMDWFGLILISLAIGSLQYVLDRGNQVDWLSNDGIRIGVIVTIISLLGFLWHSIRSLRKSSVNIAAPAVFDLRIFKDRNFTIASILFIVFGLGLNGTMAIQPLFLENLLQYPVIATGIVMSPRGISVMFSMLLVSKIITWIDTRLIIAAGIVFCSVGMLACTYYSIDINTWTIVWPQLLQGIGFGLIFVPISTVAMATIPVSVRVEAAGLFSLVRTIGSSIGISITETLLTRHTQIAWNQLGGFIQPYNTAVAPYLQTMHLKLSNPLSAHILGNVLGEQAQMVAFVNVYAFVMWCFLLMLPMVLLLKKNSVAKQAPVAMEH